MICHECPRNKGITKISIKEVVSDLPDCCMSAVECFTQFAGASDVKYGTIFAVTYLRNHTLLPPASSIPHAIVTHEQTLPLYWEQNSQVYIRFECPSDLVSPVLQISIDFHVPISNMAKCAFSVSNAVAWFLQW